MVQEQPDGSGDEVNCDLRVEPLSGVDVSDAAARLQSRGAATDDNIFEILPRFSVSPGPTNEKWVDAYMKRKKEVLAVSGTGELTGIIVGCELLAFEKDKDELSKQLHFPAMVDMVVWRRSILLIGLSTAELILIDPNTYKQVFNWKASDVILDGKERHFVDAFLHANPDRTKIDLITVSQAGKVLVFREISLSNGSLDATVDQNMSVDIDLGSVREHYEHLLTVGSKVVSACSPSRNIVIVIEESGDIQVLNIMRDDNLYGTRNIFLDSSPWRSRNEAVPTKIASFEGDIFVLLSTGCLLTGGMDMKLITLEVPEQNAFLHDFTVVTNKNEGSIKVWILYSVQDSSGLSNYLGIFGGPSFIPEFTFKLPMLDKNGEKSWFKFPKNTNPCEEPTAVVEMASNNVYLFHILETSTDVTLQKLLSRGKFVEAMDLATSYGKDLDIVRKAQARNKLDQIYSRYSLDGPEIIEALWKELLNILGDVVDGKFVCNFSVEAQLHRVDYVKKLLDLARGRVTDCAGSREANTLLLTAKMFYTFELVCPGGTITDWKDFISKDNNMYLQSIKFLQKKHFEKCERIWKRHSEDFISTITLVELLPFFSVLFDHQLRSRESVSLMSTILPFAIEKVVAASRNPGEENLSEMPQLKHLIDSIKQQVLTLESTVEWPMNALKFIREFSSVIKVERKRLDTLLCEPELIWQMKKDIVDFIGHQLAHVEQILTELAELKRNHSIRIHFDDYTKDSIPEVVNKLLFKLLSKDEVEGFVGQYLKPYADRKGFDVDYLFAEHITSVLHYIHYYIQAINIPHEERIICLVNLISSTNKRLTSALQIAQEWPVPWSPGITEMVDKILAIPRKSLDMECVTLYDEILVMKKQVPFRCVVSKYKLNSTKLCSKRAYVLMALYKILKMATPGFEQDCREILKQFPSKTLIDDVAVDYVDKVLRMSDENIEVEDALPGNLGSNRNLMKALFQKSFWELQNIETAFSSEVDPKEQERAINIYEKLCIESEDTRNIMLCKLKQFLPDIPLDIIYAPEFPYECIQTFVQDTSGTLDIGEMMKNCKKLAQITQTFVPDVLIALALYLVPTGVASSYSPELWAIVEDIVKAPCGFNINNTPANKELLQVAAFQVAGVLVLQCPELSLSQMDCLKDFICQLCESFEDMTTQVAGLLSFYRIFLSLKEQEIPLETNFLEICKWLLGVSNPPWEKTKKMLTAIGETLLKFGELDVCSSVLKCIERQVLMFIRKVEKINPQAVATYTAIREQIQEIKNDLWKLLPTLVDEVADGQMRKLVKDLNEVGVRVNVYALKIRNKLKLLERLLNLKSYKVAADLAVIFQYYQNHSIWSQILEGLISTGVHTDLRQVLERIKLVPDLWMLPEFARGWRQVSKVDSDFADLCPISL